MQGLHKNVVRTLKWSPFLKSGISRYSQAVHQNISTDPVWISVSPGARVLELRAPDSGNMMTADVLNTIQTKLGFYEQNHTVGAVIVVSEDPNLFSNGIDDNDVEKDEKKRRIVAANSLSTFISKMEQGNTTAMVAVYSGSVGASAYSIFASAQFRLGTPSTKFRVQEDLTRGNLPLGGLAYHMGRSSPEGVAMARYLAISQRELTAHDMCSLGLLTHIVEEEPHESLVHALAHTIPVDDNIKAVQSSAVDATSLRELLDTMDVESEFGEDESIMDDPVWDKMMLVRPQKVDMEDFFEGNEQESEDIEDISEEVNVVFKSDSIDECLTALRGNKSAWAVGMADKIDEIPREVLESWFTLTRKAHTDRFQDVCQFEEQLL